MNNQFSYENFDPSRDDLDELLGLFSNEYGQVDPAQRDYFNWYCLENPSGQAMLPVARHRETGQIIGGCWLVPIRVRVDGRNFVGGNVVNFIVARAFRRQQVGISVLSYSVKIMADMGIDFMSGITNQNSTKVGERSVWKKIGPQDLLVHVIDWTFLQYTGLNRVPFLSKPVTLAANLVSPLIFRSHSTTAFESKYKIEEIDHIGPEFDRFWERVRDKYPIMYVRDSTYLRWRYEQNPRRSYTILAAFDREDIVAYVVTRTSKVRQYHAGFIVDFLVEKSMRGEQAGRILVEEAKRELQKERIELIFAMVPSRSEEGRIIRHQGFIVSPKRMQPLPLVLFMNATGEGLPTQILDKLDNWFIQMGDYDLV